MNWLRQSARAALLRRPDWTGLRASPWGVAGLVALAWLMRLGVERLYVVGDARFYGRAFFADWLGTACTLWLCWLVLRRAPADARSRPRDVATLFALLCLQSLVLGGVLALAFVPLARGGAFAGALPRAWQWVAWLAPTGWVVAATVGLLWRSGPRRAGLRLLVLGVVAGLLYVEQVLNPVHFWYPAPPPAVAQDDDGRLALTQAQLEAEPGLLSAALEGLAPQRPGLVDLYAITFAPYASQDVFMRESALVAGVMAERFDARGRVVQLVDNRATLDTLPWATATNLRRAIAAAARRMDRDEDVLFLHLTSHGGADGNLAIDFDPLEPEPVTPQLLKQWLDDAGVRWRVISISACYSGSWIAPLAGDGTLVMTAADADHTSYGCGSKSELTFFGRAMYDEQLRRTRSFEDAHAAARQVIDQREREAGKTDGYSNPQIRVGAAIRPRLLRLQAELARGG